MLSRTSSTAVENNAEAMAKTTKEDLSQLAPAELAFVYGDRDVICPPPSEQGPVLGRTGDSHVVEGAHLMFIEEPAAFVAELDRMFRSAGHEQAR